ncbi:MAG: TraR/DksA family transcriptional regulator [Angustibacter sp.]
MPASADGSSGASEPLAVLRAEREQLAEQLTTLQREFDRVVDASASSNADDEHDPEGSTIAFERAQLAAVLDQTRERLADVDRAVEQVASGDYGRCARCGQPIDPERLVARPTATLCITCARATRP